MNDKKRDSRPPSVQANDTAPRTLPHSSGDRNTQNTSDTRKETFGGGVQRRPNIDVPRPEPDEDTGEEGGTR